MSWIETRVKIQDEKHQVLLSSRWTLGFKDRGHGHGDFGVLMGNEEECIECPSKEMAEHIINLHNCWRD